MANADAEEIKQKFLQALLTYALTRALEKLHDASGPAGSAVIDQFEDGFRKSVKNSTPEGPTTEAELMDMVETALALGDKIFCAVRANRS
jgi:hypothetical protein